VEVHAPYDPEQTPTKTPHSFGEQAGGSLHDQRAQKTDCREGTEKWLRQPTLTNEQESNGKQQTKD
jgi:hypothetical protein